MQSPVKKQGSSYRWSHAERGDACERKRSGPDARVARMEFWSYHVAFPLSEMLKKSTTSLAFFLLCQVQGSGTPSMSALWGTSGEAWSRASRLSDFSRAGYACGLKDIPGYPVLSSVKDHGAKGDGVTDDTAAFREALRTVGELSLIHI